MYKRILLAYDGSLDGREALAQAKSLASASGATVHLLAIIDLSENMLVVEGMAFIPDNRRYVMQSVLDAGVKRLQSVGCTATNDIRYGNPAEQIVLTARGNEGGPDHRRPSRSRHACTLAERIGRRIGFASSALQHARRGQTGAHGK
jgi:nucleotide-binding universal stress UspA family protein